MAGSAKIELLISAKNTADRALKDARNDVRRLERDVRRASDSLEQTGEGRADVERLARSLDRARREARDLGTEAKDLQRKIDGVGDASRDTNVHMKKGTSASGGFAGGLGGIATKAGVAGAAIGAVVIAVKQAAEGFWRASEAAAAYEQAGIKNAQVFGAQSKMMKKWARQHAEDFGTSTRETLSYAAGIQDLLVPMGFQRKEAANMTKEVGNIIPALQEWDKQGRSTEEITDIVTAALTGETDSLKSLGIGISQNLIDKKIEAMRASGKLKGASEEEAQAMATLALIDEKSADAQKVHNKGTLTMAKAMKKLKSGIAEIKDSGLSVMVGVFRHLAGALKSVGIGGKKGGLQGIADWVKQNRQQIIGFVMRTISGVMRLGGVALDTGADWMDMASMAMSSVATTLDALSLLKPSLKDSANKAHNLANNFSSMATKSRAGSKKLNELADAVDKQGDKAFAAQRKNNAHRASMEKAGAAASHAKGKVGDYHAKLDGVPKTVNTTVDVKPAEGFGSSLMTALKGLASMSPVGLLARAGAALTGGDTPTPHARSVGPLPGGLGAAHALADAGIPGSRTIISAQRFHNLGSPGSDHAAGRALDLVGPGLNAYAGQVRAAGGYAAFHGSGPQRHLHAVPAGGGGTAVTQHITNNITAAQTVDVVAAMRRSQRVAAQSARELAAS